MIQMIVASLFALLSGISSQNPVDDIYIGIERFREYYDLPKLPYSYDSMTPWIDEPTMEVHHNGHHKTYTAKMNAALQEWRASVSKKKLNPVGTRRKNNVITMSRRCYEVLMTLSFRRVPAGKVIFPRFPFLFFIIPQLYKAFDCVPHDLVIVKLYAYDFDLKALKYILSYLTDREQSTHINGIYSDFQIIISGVPQGSILGPIIFNIFNNDLMLFVEKCNVHNYADDNTLSSFSNSIPHLIKILESETNATNSRLTNKNMIANPDKFHSIIITKNKAKYLDIKVKIGNKVCKAT